MYYEQNAYLCNILKVKEKQSNIHLHLTINNLFNEFKN